MEQVFLVCFSARAMANFGRMGVWTWAHTAISAHGSAGRTMWCAAHRRAV